MRLIPINAGDIFGYWKVVTGERINGEKALFECECGTRRIRSVSETVRNGGSCGCKNHVVVKGGLKTCSKCNESLPIGEFHVIRTRGSRLTSRCKKCSYEDQKEWRKTESGREYLRIQSKKDRNSEAGKKRAAERVKDEAHYILDRSYGKAYRARHPERVKRNATLSRVKNRENYKAWRRKYLKTDIGKAVVSRYVNKRRLRLESAVSTLTAAEWAATKELFNYCCCYCGESTKLTIDHLVPLVNGGDHTADNAVPACLSCNCKKNAREPEEWIDWLLSSGIDPPILKTEYATRIGY